MKRSIGITFKLTFVFVLFAFALVVSLNALIYANVRASLKTATLSELLSTSLEKQSTLNDWVDERQKTTAALASAPYVTAAVAKFNKAEIDSTEARLAYDDLVANLLPYVKPQGTFLEVMLLDPETGQVTLSTAAEEVGKFKENQPFFINGKNGSYVQNVYYSITLKAPAMTASAPIYSQDGRLLAVLAARIDMNELNAFITRYTGLHQSDEAYLVNASNLYITQPRLISDPAVLQRGAHSEAVNRCLEYSSGTISALDYRGVQSLIVYKWLSDRNVCLIVKIDEAEALAPANTLSRTITAVSGLILIVTSVLAYWLARSITQPILILQEGAARFGRGELDHQIEVRGTDEIGDLAVSMSGMANNLRNSRTELENSIKELDAFSYSVSHDLRAPLRAIDGFSQALLRMHAPSLGEAGQHYLKRILTNTQNMSDLIDGLLQLSRLSRQPINLETISTLAIVNQALEELHAEQADRQVDFSIAQDLPACQSDAILLKQVYINLLSNALKFTRAREQTRIEVGFLPAGGNPIYFVRDNGAGFDMAFADKLFGAFQRLHSYNEFPGTGIGLAIAQRIIHRHGGRVWAEAQVDRGATFFFTLAGDK